MPHSSIDVGVKETWGESEASSVRARKKKMLTTIPNINSGQGRIAVKLGRKRETE